MRLSRLVLGLALALSASLHAGQPAGANLCPNGGFEVAIDARATDGKPVTWGTHIGKGKVDFAVVEQGARSGNRCAYIHAHKPDPSGYWCSPRIPVEGGQQYLFRCWFKSKDVEPSRRGIVFSLNFRTAEGKACGWPGDQAEPFTQPWTKLEFLAYASPRAAYVNLVIGLADSPGELWIDDIHFATTGKTFPLAPQTDAIQAQPFPQHWLPDKSIGLIQRETHPLLFLIQNAKLKAVGSPAIGLLLPDGIIPVGGDYRVAPPARGEPVEHDGKKLTRWVCPVADNRHLRKTYDYYRGSLVCLRAAAPVGEHQAFYFFTCDQESQPPQPVTIKVLPPLPKPPELKRYHIGFLLPDAYRAGGKALAGFADLYAHTGMNVCTFSVDRDPTTLSGYLKQRGVLRHFLLQGTGIVYDCAYGNRDPGIAAIGADGKPMLRGLCPTYAGARGTHFEQMPLEGIIARWVRADAMDGFTINWEPPGPFKLDVCCFCPRCLDAFAKQAGIPRAELDRLGAKGIVEKHKAQWARFRAETEGRIAKAYYDKAEELGREVGRKIMFIPWTAPTRFDPPRPTQGQIDEHILGGDVEHPFYYHQWVHAYGPFTYAYYDVLYERWRGHHASTVRHAQQAVAFAKAQDPDAPRPVWLGIEGVQKGSRNTLCWATSPAQMEVEIVCALAEGCRGIYVYTGRGMDGHFYTAAARAVRRAALLEGYPESPVADGVALEPRGFRCEPRYISHLAHAKLFDNGRTKILLLASLQFKRTFAFTVKLPAIADGQYRVADPIVSKPLGGKAAWTGNELRRGVAVTLRPGDVRTYVLDAARPIGNLLANPSFVTATPDGKLEAWAIPPKAASACSRTNEDGQDNNACLRFRLAAAAVVPPATQGFACQPHTDYVLAAWFKSDGRLRPAVWLAAEGDDPTRVVAVVADGAASWVRKTMRFNSGRLRRMRAEVYADAATAGKSPRPVGPGRALVDCVEVVKAAELADDAELKALALKPPGPNIARGKPYTWNRPPNYKHCKDDADTTQLTDGEYTVGYFWAQTPTVGWQNVRPLMITIDLGKAEPIAGVSYNLGAGTAGVAWPNAIAILVSDDGKTFYDAGELTELAAARGLPPYERYAIVRYFTDRLAARGRFVRFVVSAPGYCFCDEIEVYRGPDRLLTAAPRGEPVRDVRKLLAARTTRGGARLRVQADIRQVRERAQVAPLDAATRKRLLDKLQELSTRAATMDVRVDEDFKAVAPLNALHEAVIAQHAPVLRAHGLSGMVAWHRCRWDPLGIFDRPSQEDLEPFRLRARMMRGEYRAEVLNLTNATDTALEVRLTLEGMPDGARPDWIEPHEVLFVDTVYRRFIADPIVPLGTVGEACAVRVPAGMTKQVWLRFHPTDVPPGDYTGRVVLATPGLPAMRLPLTVHVSKLRFPKQPALSLCLCDYTDHPSYDLKLLGDMDKAVANLQAHFVDNTWAHASTAAIPTPGHFDAQGNLAKPLDFSRFDRWVKRWRGTPRVYTVFLNLGRHFAGVSLAHPQLEKRVSAWAAAWRKHVVELGLPPDRISVLIMDEFSTDEQARRITQWAKAIKAGYPDILILETICDQQPHKSKVQELYEITDILMPPLPHYYAGGEPVRKFYADLVAKGKRLWTYHNGTNTTSDPYQHQRVQEWECWVNGMTGSGYWAYCDAGGNGSWNPYAATSTNYSPAYISRDAIADGKHWEAIREGTQDYEYLRMLRDRIAQLRKRGVPAAVLREAETLLREAPRRVVRGTQGNSSAKVWTTPKDRTVADKECARLLDMLERLSAM